VSREWPWSRPLRWTDAVPGGISVRITADESDRARAAEGLDAVGIERLAAELDIEPWRDGFQVRGALRASVTRTCGVSLDSFEEYLDEPILLRFVPTGSPNAPPPPEGDVELDLEADDPPECVAGDLVDLGACLTEQLALGLSPFPRKPGVEFQPPAMSGSLSPFAALATLRADLRKDD
jgi:hypothetical protein